MNLSTIWSAAGVLVGFQVAAFTLRINREIDVGDKGDITWLPLADMLNMFSLAMTTIGVFLAPVAGLGSVDSVAKVFGLSVILLTGYPFALAGHYEMFSSGTRTHTWLPFQEKVCIAATGVACALYVVVALTP